MDGFFSKEDFMGPFKDGSTGQVWVREKHLPEPLFTAEMCAYNSNLKVQHLLQWMREAREVLEYLRDHGVGWVQSGESTQKAIKKTEDCLSRFPEGLE